MNSATATHIEVILSEFSRVQAYDLSQDALAKCGAEMLRELGKELVNIYTACVSVMTEIGDALSAGDMCRAALLGGLQTAERLSFATLVLESDLDRLDRVIA